MNITEANATISILRHAGLLHDDYPTPLRPTERLEADLAVLANRASKALRVALRIRYEGLGAELVASEVDDVDLTIEAQAANTMLESTHEGLALAVTKLNDSLFHPLTGELDLPVAVYLAGEQARHANEAYQLLRVLLDELHEHAEGVL